MQTYLDNGMIFSFLAHADAKLENEQHDEVRKMSISILNLGSYIVGGKLRIALLLPYKVIGRYASSTTDASFAYLIAKNHSFELKSYKIENEDIDEIKKALLEISNDGFNYVIAPFTQKGADAISEINPEINIFFPTINKKDVTSTSSYLHYGGIDYQAQSDMLLKEAVSPLVIFYDDTTIGNKLSQYEEKAYLAASDTIEKKSVVKFAIPKRTTNLEKQLSDNKSIVEGTFFINTPIVKTGMIMSQLTLYEANAAKVLSTQINYDPLILSITQFEDRKNMIIANSITENNNILIETNLLLGNDIVYDWINYTTTVGVDYFYSKATREDREYNIELKDNQMIYQIELLNPAMYRFVKYNSRFKER